MAQAKGRVIPASPIGHFTTRDAVEGSRRNVEQFSAYEIDRGNPWVFRDPTGRVPSTALGQVTAVGIVRELASLALSRPGLIFLGRVGMILSDIELVHAGRWTPNGTTNEKHACRALGLSPEACSEAIHAIKNTANKGDENVEIDTETGDVYDVQTGEYLGNLRDENPGKRRRRRRDVE